MRRELTDKLKATFPTFFRKCGLECGDGWFKIIWNLCHEIQSLNPSPEFEVTQVKEKFATLRFCINNGIQDIYDAIDRAEHLSAVTCEECGADGRCRGGGWLRTLCDLHAE